MFKRILIANRGEIAVRVMRTCREMGISPVAVFSEADREARHVRMADGALCIGPPAARESYLDIQKILDAAHTLGAEAIHPGYGFLSENGEFARACEAAGVVFIGPDARAIREMGDKRLARAPTPSRPPPGGQGWPRFIACSSRAAAWWWPISSNLPVRHGGWCYGHS